MPWWPLSALPKWVDTCAKKRCQQDRFSASSDRAIVSCTPTARPQHQTRTHHALCMHSHSFFVHFPKSGNWRPETGNLVLGLPAIRNTPHSSLPFTRYTLHYTLHAYTNYQGIKNVVMFHPHYSFSSIYIPSSAPFPFLSLQGTYQNGSARLFNLYNLYNLHPSHH